MDGWERILQAASVVDTRAIKDSSSSSQELCFFILPIFDCGTG